MLAALEESGRCKQCDITFSSPCLWNSNDTSTVAVLTTAALMAFSQAGTGGKTCYPSFAARERNRNANVLRDVVHGLHRGVLYVQNYIGYTTPNLMPCRCVRKKSAASHALIYTKFTNA